MCGVGEAALTDRTAPRPWRLGLCAHLRPSGPLCVCSIAADGLVRCQRLPAPRSVTRGAWLTEHHLKTRGLRTRRHGLESPAPRPPVFPGCPPVLLERMLPERPTEPGLGRGGTVLLHTGRRGRLSGEGGRLQAGCPCASGRLARQLAGEGRQPVSSFLRRDSGGVALPARGDAVGCCVAAFPSVVLLLTARAHQCFVPREESLGW